MLYEDTSVDDNSDKRFHVELHFSPGSYAEFDVPKYLVIPNKTNSSFSSNPECLQEETSGENTDTSKRNSADGLDTSFNKLSNANSLSPRTRSAMLCPQSHASSLQPGHRHSHSHGHSHHHHSHSHGSTSHRSDKKLSFININKSSKHGQNSKQRSKGSRSPSSRCELKDAASVEMNQCSGDDSPSNGKQKVPVY